MSKFHVTLMSGQMAQIDTDDIAHIVYKGTMLDAELDEKIFEAQRRAKFEKSQLAGK